MKTYIVVCHEVQDEGALLRQMTAEEIREYAAKHAHEDFAVIDGEVVKGFSKKLDVGRLKDK